MLKQYDDSGGLDVLDDESSSGAMNNIICVSFPLPEARSRLLDDLSGTYDFPVALEPCTQDVANDTIAALHWAQDSSETIERHLCRYGALLLRGFPIRTPQDFAHLTEALGWPNFGYEASGGNAVRRNVVGDRVFTANESPPDKVIPFHHELAQTARYPHRVAFFCENPAMRGGATPLLDSGNAYARLRSEFPEGLAELQKKGVRYTRVMTVDDRPHSAIGRGWADTFGVSTPQELEAKLASSGDKLEWLGVSLSHLGVDGDRYPVRHYTDVRPAVLVDPSDPERRPRFFNQILAAHTGWRDELNAPGASVVLGDGTPMRQDMLDAMERIFLEESVSVQWRAGDVMLINNLQVMHARETFVDGEAPRRVLASLGRDPAPVMEERMANVHGEHGVGSNKAHKYAWQATGGERRTRGPPALRESKTRAKVIRGNPGIAAGRAAARGPSRASASLRAFVARPPAVLFAR